MPTNKNKFNTSTKTKDWFPYPKFLFATDNHPIRQSQDKCSSSIEALFSQQELEQINGITNSLQCETRDAIRIALYETCKDAQSAYDKSYDKAKSGSKIKGHEGRKTNKRLNLPLSEKQAALDASKQLNISIKEFLRLAVIWLADGIKEESIIRLSKSKRINKDEVAMQWSRENQGKPPSESTSKLKKARDEAYEESANRGREYDDALYAERGRMMDKLNDSGIGRALNHVSPSARFVNEHKADGIDLSIVDASIEMEKQEVIDESLSKFEVQDELEREIFRVMIQSSPNLSDEDIKEMAKCNIKERLENKKWRDFIEKSSDEELLKHDYFMFWQFRTPFNPFSTEFTWQGEDDAKLRDGESLDEYVLRSLPFELHSEWNAYCSD